MTANGIVKESATETGIVTEVTGMNEATEIVVGTEIATETEIATTKTGSETLGTETVTESGTGARKGMQNAIEGAEKGTTVTCAPKVIVIGVDLTHPRARSAIAMVRFLLKMPQSLVKKRLPSLPKKRLTVPRCGAKTHYL